jgi:hypothetical protein
MSNLIASYDDHELLVVAVRDGCPMVFFQDRIQPATDVKVCGHRLTDIYRAPVVIPAPPGYWADYEYAADGEPPERQSYPIVALQVDVEFGHASAYVLKDEDIEVAHTETSGRHRFLGYRPGHSGALCQCGRAQ